MLNPAKSSSKSSKEYFEDSFKRDGFASQRMYPNEALVQFMMGRFGCMEMDKRYAVRVLEVGCGSGANLWMLAKEGFDVHGLDASAVALSLAQAHLAKKWNVDAELACGDFTHLPYPDEYFDVVVDIVSLQHLCLKGKALALSEVARVLKGNGAFFSYRLSDRSVMYSHSASPMVDAATVENITAPLPLADNGPTSFLGPSLATMLYSDAGLSIDSIQSFARTYKSGDFVEYLAIEASLI
jgi:SAM-dependent methyltransferase